MNDDDERENLTWPAFGVASRDLARAIAADGFEPDLILSIARGGLFVAGSFGYALAVKNLHVMNVEFYDGVGSTLDMPVMLPPVPSAVDFSAKKVLIADDVAHGQPTRDAAVARSVIDQAKRSAASAVSPSAAASRSPRSPARSASHTAPAPRTALARTSGSSYHRECSLGTGSEPADAEVRLRVAAESSWGTR
jgi:hypothetical protein